MRAVNEYGTHPNEKHTGVYQHPVVCASAFWTTSPPIIIKTVVTSLGFVHCDPRIEAVLFAPNIVKDRCRANIDVTTGLRGRVLDFQIVWPWVQPEIGKMSRRNTKNASAIAPDPREHPHHVS